MNFKLNAFLIFVVLLITGCFNHTYIGGIEYYPPEADYRAAQSILSITIHGAPRKSYAEQTPKKIVLCLRKKDGTVLVEKKYNIEAGALEWAAQWANENKVNIVFYEYNNKYVTSIDGRPEPSMRQIFSVEINGGLTKEDYVSGEVPVWLIDSTSNEIIRDSKRQIIEVYFQLCDDTTKSILATIKEIAKEIELLEKDVPSGLIGCLAEYEAQNFQLTVQRYDSQKEIEVSIQDWGRPELSQYIEQRLKKGSVVRIRRFVSLSVPIYNISQVEVLKIVNKVAKRHGLTKNHTCPPAYIACYGDNRGIEIQIYYFKAPERLKISIEEINARDNGLTIESELKEKLPYHGKENKL